MPRTPTDALPAADPSLLILASLAECPKHGYAMIEDVERFAGVRLGPGTLYGALTRLVERRLIEALETEHGDRRRPYRLTALGRDVLESQLGTMRDVADTGLRRLGRATRAPAVAGGR